MDSPKANIISLEEKQTLSFQISGDESAVGHVQSEHDSPPHDTTTVATTTNVDKGGGVEEKEEDNIDSIIKLFVGQIPRTMEASKVATLFSRCGTVIKATIISNNMDEHKGCAFVYMSKNDANVAIAEFHNKKNYHRDCRLCKFDRPNIPRKNVQRSKCVIFLCLLKRVQFDNYFRGTAKLRRYTC